MMFQAGDLGLTIDYGISRTGSILQRKTNGEWQDYLVDGESLIYPMTEVRESTSSWVLVDYTRLWRTSATALIKTKPNSLKGGDDLPFPVQGVR
jgi:hypothetical protein